MRFKCMNGLANLEELIMNEEQITIAEKKYRGQKSHSKTRGIDFNLSFDEWLNIWLKSGHWEQRGRGKGTYVMSRVGDTGPYEIGNVFIQTNYDNVIQAQKGSVRSAESNLKRKLTQSGRKQSAEWIEKRIKKVRGPYKKKVEV